MARPTATKATFTSRSCKVKFPNGLDVEAFVREGDGTVTVKPQSSERLSASWARAWAAYYDAAAEILEEIGQG